MLRKVFSDGSLWILIIFNLYLLHYYHQHPNDFRTLILLYWLQSVMIGIANFFNLLTLPRIKEGSIFINGEPIKQGSSGNGCLAFFFLFHYGVFHIVYAVFLLMKTDGHFNYSVFKIGAAIILVNIASDFLRQKIRQRHIEVDVGKAFFLPYARIIPMHFMILLPEFFHLSNITVFIVLKIILDIVMHIAMADYGKKPEADLSSVS